MVWEGTRGQNMRPSSLSHIYIYIYKTSNATIGFSENLFPVYYVFCLSCQKLSFCLSIFLLLGHLQLNFYTLLKFYIYGILSSEILHRLSPQLLYNLLHQQNSAVKCRILHKIH